MQMSHNIYTPFLEATRNVFHLMLDLSDIDEGPAENFRYDDTLNISIGVVGDLKGEIIYKFPSDTSLSMVTIMSGMEIDSVDEFVTSAISEIANIISGNVLNLLAETDINCDILPPALKLSEDAGEYNISNDFCINTSVGPVCLGLRLNS